MKLIKLLFIGLALGGIISSAFALTKKEVSTLATIATIDKNEIVISTVASNKTKNNDILDFTKMMVSQHGSNLNQILTFSNQSHELALALAQGTAEKLLIAGNMDLTKLGVLQGIQFDQAYINAMVTGHEAALQLINTKLMQTASSEAMKQFLISTKDVVIQHLEHAKTLQKKMSN